MSNEFLALGVIFIFIFATTIVGMLPGMKEKLSLEGWAIGGRGFGRGLSWFVLAGEIYTAFAFLGASGWAYARGGPTFYILGYGALAYVVGYYVLPKISPIGKKFGLMTQPDLVQHIYDSKPLGILTAVIGVLFLLPYLQLQLTGLGIIIQTCSYGLITKVPAMLIAFTLVAIFVYLSGLKGVAITAIIKDVVMIIAVVFFGLYLPFHFFGNLGNMFDALNAAKPGFLALPGGTKVLDVSWVMSTLVLTSLGFYMWPHFSANSFSAKSPEVLRHNAVFLPLYQICLLFPMLIGFTALLILPGLSNPDMSFMVMVQKVFPGWALGLVGGAGALACMIPASDLILNTSMIFTRNIYCRGFNPKADNVHQKFVARIIVFIVTATALCLAIFAPNLLVNLLLIGYSGVTQFFPMIVLGLFWKRSTKIASFCGLIVGEILVVYLTLNKLDPVTIFGLHLNAGFVALMVNLIIFIVISIFTSNNDNITAKEERLNAS